MKYAFYFSIFALVMLGAFFSGVAVGRGDVRTEYVVKEKEVIKYVEKKKADIYSRPNATRSDLLRMFHNSEL